METAAHPLQGSLATINPYLHGLKLIAGRLRWDCTVEAWKSRSRLKAWKDRHAGGRAAIVCNGPSLLQSDLSQLDGVFTLGLNKINLLFDKRAFRPACVVAVNHLVIDQNRAFFNETDLPLFLDGYARRLVAFRDNVVLLHTTEQAKMARDCSMSVQQGGTVTYVALQLAFHMGFRDVALIGCDHTFAQKGVSNQTVVSGEKDESHFDPKYFSGGVKWQLPDLAASEYHYALARDTYAAYGGRVVNCTEGGKLEIFERMALADWRRG